jgi:hypothetical protein
LNLNNTNRRMGRKFGILGIGLFVLLFSCKNNDWENHYNSPVATINTNVWDALQKEGELSQFVQYIKKYKYDTLFVDTIFLPDNTYKLIDKDNPYTLFAPTNSAFSQLLNNDSITSGSIAYHISTFFIQSGNIRGKRKVETYNQKFALFEKADNLVKFDGIALEFESPLYVNGKYFIMNEVATPKPNLYEYISSINPVLKDYIDSQDSSILDKELSRPLYFDEFGNTIYDTVSVKYNKFEAEFFPISKEFRFQTATLVFPREEDYNNALTTMAVSLGGNFTDYKDISLVWQEKILIPYLLKHGVFENMVEPEEFTIKTSGDTIKMKNILGDSIIIDYMVEDKTLCSNGYAYNYANFVVPDTLFTGITRFEGELLLNEIGINKFVWDDKVTVKSDVSYSPLQELIPTASNDTIIKVTFTKGYSGNFSIEFNIDNIFPRRYQMICGTNTNLGGIYNIYVNDEMVKNFDYYYYVLNKDIYKSITGKRYPSKAGFNIFDCLVENLTEYGKTKIKFEYVGPGRVLYNGLSIDYIEFVPY